jgi:PTH2 family peptidyl-tRNA hydrolase
MKEVKQVIIWRNDLNVRKGKMMSQAAHASLKVFLDISNNTEFPEFTQNGSIYVPYSKGSEFDVWLNGSFTKIVLKVNSEEELRGIYNKAQEAGIPCSLIVDNGKTEFNGVPTTTCCAIGPAYSEDIDEFTGHLELM